MFLCLFCLYFSVDKAKVLLETNADSKGPQSCDEIFWSSPLWHSENQMATTLAPVDSREVVRCDHCHLVQFLTTNHFCRRCRASLDPEEPEAVAVEAQVAVPTNGNGHAHLQVATAIRALRLRSGLSQRQLALRMQVPRTYVSTIENAN